MKQECVKQTHKETDVAVVASVDPAEVSSEEPQHRHGYDPHAVHCS